MIATGLPILTIPIYTTYIPPKDYGLYAISIALGTILSGLPSLGLVNFFERKFFTVEIHQRESLLFTYLIVYSILFFPIFIITGVILFQFNLNLFGVDFSNYKLLLMGMIFSSFLANVKTLYLTFLKNYDNHKLHGIVSSSDPILYAIISLFFLLIGKFGIFSLVLGQVLALMFLLVYLTIKIIDNNYIIKLEIKPVLKDIKISSGLIPRSFGGMLSAHLDKIILTSIFDASTLGIYSIGQRIGMANFSLITSFYNIKSAEILELMFESKGNREAIEKSIILPLILASTLSILAVSFSGIFTYFFLPFEYQGSVSIINIFITLSFVYFFTKIPQLLFGNKTLIISLLSYLSIIISSILCYIFGQNFGYISAAYGVLIGGIILTILTFIIGQKSYLISYPKPLVFISITSLLLSLLSDNILESNFLLFFIKPILGVCSVILIWLLFGRKNVSQ